MKQTLSKTYQIICSSSESTYCHIDIKFFYKKLYLLFGFFRVKTLHYSGQITIHIKKSLQSGLLSVNPP